MMRRGSRCDVEKGPRPCKAVFTSPFPLLGPSPAPSRRNRDLQPGNEWRVKYPKTQDGPASVSREIERAVSWPAASFAGAIGTHLGASIIGERPSPPP